MRVKVLEALSTARGVIPVGEIIDIPTTILERLKGKVEQVQSEAVNADKPANNPVLHSTNGQPEPKAWLTGSGELRTHGVFDDLAGEIIKLTADNLSLQARLLRECCGAYSGPQWRHLVEAWNERAAIMEYDGGMQRIEAELMAAKFYRIEAFLEELINPISGELTAQAGK